MKRISFVTLILLFMISGCSKDNDLPETKEPVIQLSELKSFNIGGSQNDVFTDTMVIKIINSSEVYDTIYPQFTRKIKNGQSVLLKLSSIVLEKNGEKISNYDVSMDIGHYSTLTSGSPNYSFRVGEYRFIASVDEEGMYTISFSLLN